MRSRVGGQNQAQIGVRICIEAIVAPAYYIKQAGAHSV